MTCSVSTIFVTRCSKVRDQEGILSVQVAYDQVLKGVFYHCRCRSTFTHKHDLDRIEKTKNDEKEKEVEAGMESTRQGRMHVRLNKNREKES